MSAGPVTTPSGLLRTTMGLGRSDHRKTQPASRVVVLCALLGTALGHAWLEQPPGRASAWRLGFPTPKNYNDNGLNCGGADVHHGKFASKCGLCGDPYGGPRLHEPGPDNVYATGVIVANYTQGQAIAVRVRITASHKGYHEFRLFKNNVPQLGRDAGVAVQYKSHGALLASPHGRTRFDEYDPAIVLRLPGDVLCEACVLQWRWRVGNSWGCDKEGCGMGFGDQEEFYGCADVRIVRATASTQGRPSEPVVTSSSLASASSAGHHRTTSESSPRTQTLPDPNKNVSDARSLPTTRLAAAATTQPPAAASVTPSVRPASNWATDSREGSCGGDGGDGHSRVTQAAGTKPGGAKAGVLRCEARAPYSGDMSKWCNINCNRVPRFCPLSHCACVND